MIELKMLRKSKKLSQKEVADQLGISRQAYSNYELDKRTMNITHAKELANILQCSINEIIGRTSEEIINSQDEFLYVEKEIIKNFNFNYYINLEKNNVQLLFDKVFDLQVNNLYLVEYEGSKFISKYHESNGNSVFIKDDRLITLPKDKALKVVLAKVLGINIKFN